MARFFSLALAALSLSACGTAERTENTRDPAPATTDGPDDGTTGEGAGGADQGTPTAEACAADGLHRPAQPNVSVCSADAVCDADADCALHPGTYCVMDLCAFAGCMRGGCVLTRVQGQACSRDGECVSGKCECAGAQCVCGAEEGPPDFSFP